MRVDSFVGLGISGLVRPNYRRGSPPRCLFEKGGGLVGNAGNLELLRRRQRRDQEFQSAISIIRLRRPASTTRPRHGI